VTDNERLDCCTRISNRRGGQCYVLAVGTLSTMRQAPVPRGPSRPLPAGPINSGMGGRDRRLPQEMTVMSIKREDVDAGSVDLAGVTTGKKLPPIHPGEILCGEFLEPMKISRKPSRYLAPV
jgi:hypothetical protein